jgi:hypothetical protein
MTAGAVVNMNGGTISGVNSLTVSNAYKATTNPPISGLEYVTDDDVDRKIALATAGFTLYGTTNIADSPYSPCLLFSTNQVSAWTNSYTLTNNVEQFVGCRIYTNVLSLLQAGTYEHHVNANFSGGGVSPQVVYRSDLVILNGATTNVLASGSSAQILTGVNEVDSSSVLSSNVTLVTSQRLGVVRYATYTRSSGATTCTLNIYGGNNHGTAPVVRNTRLEGPTFDTSFGDNLGNHTATTTVNFGGQIATNLSTLGFTATGITNYLTGIIQLNGTNYEYKSYYTNATSARTNLYSL